MRESCHKFEHLIGPYLDEELSGSKREQVERHLESCESCKLAALEFQLQGNLLRERLESEADAVDFSGFEDRVLERIRQEKPLGLLERAGAWVREVAYYYRAVWITSLATAVLLLAVLLPLLRSGGPEGSSTHQVAEVDNQVIIDSMEYAGQRSMIFNVSKNNTTVIWLYDFDRAEGQDQGDDI